MNEQQQPHDDEPGIVIHNHEQIEIINTLEALRVQFALAAAEVKADSEENESLHQQAQNVTWPTFTCARAERWIDHEGKLGWRCYAVVEPAHAPRILAAVASKLQNMGWDACEVVPA